MDDITILVSGAGAPGIWGTVHSLRNQDEIRFRLVGIDIEKDTVGRHLLDRVYKVPTPSSKFINSVLRICKKENVKIILPQVTKELKILSQHKKDFEDRGIKVLVSDSSPLEIAINKYQLLEFCRKNNIECTGKYFLAKSLRELVVRCHELGYPKKPFVVKLPESNGMRGLRIIDDNSDKFQAFIKEKPDSSRLTFQGFKSIFTKNNMPEILAMEYYPGIEYSVDILADKGETIVCVPRERIKIRSGITFQAKVKNHKQIINYSRRIVKALKLDYAIGLQFKIGEDGRPKLLECNPRIQGTMVASTFANANIVLGGVKQAIYGKSGLKQSDIKWNSTFYRYWGGVSASLGRM